MAGELQVSLLRQGVKVWNKWRSKRPSKRADLSRAYVLKANLSGADLSWANVSYASLGNSNFERAVVGSTIFGSVNLSSCIGAESVQHRGPSILPLQLDQAADTL
jgi:hypothetical protein